MAGRTVPVSNPDKVYFPQTGHTKLDVVRYYLSGRRRRAARGGRAADGPQAIRERAPTGEAFFQKRAPSSRPDWIETVELSFPSGRTAEEVVVRDAAQLAWVANLGCIDLNPHPVRANDLDHPDELRVDLDPVPGVEWAQIVAGGAGGPGGARGLRPDRVAEDVGLARHARLRRIEPRWTFTEVRGAAVALAREIERRAPRTWRPPSGGRRSGTASSSTTTRTPRTGRLRRRTRSGRPRTPGYPRR